MPTISEDKEKQIKRAVRDIVAVDPLVSLSSMQKYLQKKGFQTASGNPLDYRYLSKIVKKLRKEAEKRVDNTKLSERISEMKERYRIVYEKLIKIAFYSKEHFESGIKPPDNGEIIRALETITKLDLAILHAEISCGVFEKKGDPKAITGSVEALPEGKKEEVRNVLRNWGALLPEQKKIIKNFSHGNSQIQKSGAQENKQSPQ